MGQIKKKLTGLPLEIIKQLKAIRSWFCENRENGGPTDWSRKECQIARGEWPVPLIQRKHSQLLGEKSKMEGGHKMDGRPEGKEKSYYLYLASNPGLHNLNEIIGQGNHGGGIEDEKDLEGAGKEGGTRKEQLVKVANRNGKFC